MLIKIRPEKEEDFEQIKELNNIAFNRPNESLLIEHLRVTDAFINRLSLVATVDGVICGHILFYPIDVVSTDSTFKSLALGPMAVVPELQRMGIGSALVREGLRIAKNLGYQSSIVVGFPDYYPRFGFQPARDFGIDSPFELPDEVFMVISIFEDGLENIHGIVDYPEEFMEAT